MISQKNTNLSPNEEKKFKAWARAENRIGELVDYDLRGAWRAGKTDGRHPEFEKTKPKSKSAAKKAAKKADKETPWTISPSKKKDSLTDL